MSKLAIEMLQEKIKETKGTVERLEDKNETGRFKRKNSAERFIKNRKRTIAELERDIHLLRAVEKPETLGDILNESGMTKEQKDGVEIFFQSLGVELERQKEPTPKEIDNFLNTL